VTDLADIPLLARREIEAGVLGQVFDVLTERLGRAEAEAALREVVGRDARAAGAAAAAGVAPADRLAHFAAIQDRWRAGGALDAEDTVTSDAEFAYTVRHCAYADMYARLERRDLGAILSCHRDAAFAEGYDPAMRLTRGATIMEGAATCDFHYAVAEVSGPVAGASPASAGQRT
jgi:hypothetical protein